MRRATAAAVRSDPVPVGWKGNGSVRPCRSGPVDATAGSGLDVSMYGMGCAVGDFDNDGYPDILVTAYGNCTLYKNNGNVLGGGKPTLTGPYLVDKTNVDFVGKFAAAGTR